jgi:hypothetical protein
MAAGMAMLATYIGQISSTEPDDPTKRSSPCGTNLGFGARAKHNGSFIKDLLTTKWRIWASNARFDAA